MYFCVFLSRYEFKILRAIVFAVSVDVMYNFISCKFPTEQLFHYYSVHVSAVELHVWSLTSRSANFCSALCHGRAANLGVSFRTVVNLQPALL